MAQTENANNLICDVDGRLNMGNYMTSSFDSRYEGLKGSPFFISEWISGEMAFVDGRVALFDKEEALKALMDQEKLDIKTERNLVVAVAKYNAI